MRVGIRLPDDLTGARRVVAVRRPRSTIRVGAAAGPRRGMRARGRAGVGGTRPRARGRALAHRPSFVAHGDLWLVTGHPHEGEESCHDAGESGRPRTVRCERCRSPVGRVRGAHQHVSRIVAKSGPQQAGMYACVERVDAGSHEVGRPQRFQGSDFFAGCSVPLSSSKPTENTALSRTSSGAECAVKLFGRAVYDRRSGRRGRRLVENSE